jgi:hypothetical protein
MRATSRGEDQLKLLFHSDVGLCPSAKDLLTDMLQGPIGALAKCGPSSWQAINMNGPLLDKFIGQQEQKGWEQLTTP